MAKEATKKKETQKSPILNEIDTIGEVAIHYGFTPIIAPKITDDDRSKAKNWKLSDNRPGESEERLALIRLYHEFAFSNIGQPPMLYLKKPFTGSIVKKKPNVEMCGLEILNVAHSAAEALLIATAWAMLSDCGCKNMHVEINSIGDKDSLARFERELQTYFRKNAHTLTADERQQCKEDILHIATTPNAESKSFYNESPKSIGSLTEASRIHFKEMLEFLEALQLPYQINTKLLPNTQYCSHTVFEIRGTIDKTGQEILLASGGRYNYIAKRSGYKKDIPACGITVFYPKKLVAKKKLVDKIRPAKFYLVQLGNLAKLQTLSILEMLRQERINVYHSLTKENIGVQLASAEYLKVSHLLIVGQKEAIENSVVVRSMDLRDQETVAVAELCRHLKQILKK